LLPARTLVSVLVFSSIALATPPTVADPKPPDPPPPKPVKPSEGLVVVTDATWKGIATPPAGWEKADFDDTKWHAVTVTNGPGDSGQHYALANQFGVPSTASWVWLGDAQQFSLRRTFDAPPVIRRAEMLLIADDEADVRVNGEPVAVYRSANPAWGHRGGGAFVDLSPHLLPGKPNCLTATVKDNGLAKGFALEVRVNSTPFVPRLLVAKAKPPGQEVLAEVEKLAKQLDEPVFATREEATRKLVDLTRTHGQGLYDKLSDLLSGATPEAGSRLERALDILERERDSVFARVGTDGRFFYPAIDLKQVEQWWKLPAESNPLAVRHLTQAKVAHDADPKAFRAAVRKRLADGDDAEVANVVGYLAALEKGDLADAMAQVLTDRPKTLAAAVAASGLGKLGKDKLTETELKALAAAAKCGHPPTERAATVALAAIGK
jgi:hypothetical protein